MHLHWPHVWLKLTEFSPRMLHCDHPAMTVPHSSWSLSYYSEPPAPINHSEIFRNLLHISDLFYHLERLSCLQIIIAAATKINKV